jgi:hypothetical protein
MCLGVLIDNKQIPGRINHTHTSFNNKSIKGDRRGRDRMIVGFTTTYAINAYRH